MKKLYYILLSACLLTACKHAGEEWVDFGDYSALDPETAFVPYAAIDEECPLDDWYESIDESEQAVPQMRRTSSVGMINLATEVISTNNSNKIRSYCGTYKSVDVDGKPIRLSGRIILPKDGKVSRIIVVSHYTIGSDQESPSRSLPVESVFAAQGLAVVMPDYIGYGITSHLIHPYLCADITARSVVDMYLAALPFLEYIGCKPEHDDIFLFGYSQGGATTMATLRMMEQKYSDIKIRLAMAGGGPYDPCATYDLLIKNNKTDYPCAIPMIIQGISNGMHLNLTYAEFLQPQVAETLDEYINSKRYTTKQLTQLYGTNRTSDMLTEEALNKVNDGMTNLYLGLLKNSLTGYIPASPIYLFHSMDDNVVPFENAQQMLASCQQMSNVYYNFGHYGNHVKGFIRFLFSCTNLLNENGDIPKK